jgi:hypothetical protein
MVLKFVITKGRNPEHRSAPTFETLCKCRRYLCAVPTVTMKPAWPLPLTAALFALCHRPTGTGSVAGDRAIAGGAAANCVWIVLWRGVMYRVLQGVLR